MTDVAGAGVAGGAAGGLALTGLTVAREKRDILRSVGFAVPAASYTCVLGESGSGKSTLLAAIAGMVRPSHGRIELGGVVLSDAARGIFLPPQRRSLGMVFQDYLLWPHLSALDNVGLPLRRLHGSARARMLARDWLARVGLQDMGSRHPAELSGGQQQRVALARALALQPRLVLLDEPLSALDLQTRLELRALLRQLATESRFTAIHVTHDAQEALALADHLVMMRAGEVSQHGDPTEIYMRPATAAVARLTGIARLLPIHVLARDGACVATRLDAKTLLLPAGETVAAGDDAWLVLRPEALRCEPRGRAVPCGPAQLIDACYLGDRWQVEAEMPHGLGRVTFWHTARPPAELQLFLEPERAWVIRRDAAAATSNDNQ